MWPERLAMESRGDQDAWLLPLRPLGKAGVPSPSPVSGEDAAHCPWGGTESIHGFISDNFNTWENS